MRDELKATERAGAKWRAAKDRERQAMRDLEARIVEARAAGATQAAIATAAGVDRHTVLRALGTPPPSRARKGVSDE